MNAGDILTAREARYIEALIALQERVAEATFQGRLSEAKDALLPALQECEKHSPPN